MKAIIENKQITNIQEVINYAKKNNLNVYNGYDENSSAFIYSFKNHKNAIKIMYEDLYDCKKTELILKQVCPKFYPKEFKIAARRTISLSQKCKSELDAIQEGTESYEMIIWKLLLHYHGEI